MPKCFQSLQMYFIKTQNYMKWKQDNSLKKFPLSIVSSQNGPFPQVWPSVLAVLRFSCLNKLYEGSSFFSGAPSFPYTCNQAYFSFRNLPEWALIAGFCLFCYLSWEIIKHYVEYCNEKYVFKIAKILIILYRNLYTNVKGTKCLVSSTP